MDGLAPSPLPPSSSAPVASAGSTCVEFNSGESTLAPAAIDKWSVPVAMDEPGVEGDCTGSSTRCNGGLCRSAIVV